MANTTTPRSNSTVMAGEAQQSISPPLRTALICGISGQDGGYLAQLLLSKGYRVIGTARDAQAVNDFRSVLQVLSRHEPAEVYNLAGQSSVGLSFEQPVETLESISIGTLNLLEVIRFYNAGSGECFGDTDDMPADERTPFRPRSPYAVAKAAAFWQVANYREAYGRFACSGILFNHESPLRPERFITQKIVRAACRIAAGSAERLHVGNLDIQRDWGWALEYVDAMWRMLQQRAPQALIIATGETCPLQDCRRSLQCGRLALARPYRDRRYSRAPDRHPFSAAPTRSRLRQNSAGWLRSTCMTLCEAW